MQFLGEWAIKLFLKGGDKFHEVPHRFCESVKYSDAQTKHQASSHEEGSVKQRVLRLAMDSLLSQNIATVVDAGLEAEKERREGHHKAMQSPVFVIVRVFAEAETHYFVVDERHEEERNRYELVAKSHLKGSDWHAVRANVPLVVNLVVLPSSDILRNCAECPLHEDKQAYCQSEPNWPPQFVENQFVVHEKSDHARDKNAKEDALDSDLRF